MGYIVLYEGNNCSQNIVNTYRDDTGLNKKVRPNDDARSMKLTDVRIGAVIMIYDSPKGKLNDDFCIIKVKKQKREIKINSFERSYSSQFVDVTYVGNNGLDGKVSRIRVD